MDLPAQRITSYRDFGLDLYGTCYLTTRAYAQRNPTEAIAALRAAEPLTDVAIETERQALSFAEQIQSDHVTRNGLSVVDPARLGRGLNAVAEGCGLPNTLKVEDMYTDAYLPPIAERRLTAGS